MGGIRGGRFVCLFVWGLVGRSVGLYYEGGDVVRVFNFFLGGGGGGFFFFFFFFFFF